MHCVNPGFVLSVKISPDLLDDGGQNTDCRSNLPTVVFSISEQDNTTTAVHTPKEKPYKTPKNPA